MSEDNQQTPAQVTPPPTFGHLDKPAEGAPNTNPGAPASLPEDKPADAQGVTPEEPKPAEKPPEAKEPEPPPKPVAPEKYDLKLSEHSQLTTQALSKLESLAREQGLSNEQAQAMVKSSEATAHDFAEARKSQWLEQTKSDKEIGGDKLTEHVGLAAKAIERFASPALRDELNKTGFGNHPELIRMFAKIGRASANDSAVIPRTHAPEQRHAADILYDKK